MSCRSRHDPERPLLQGEVVAGPLPTPQVTRARHIMSPVLDGVLRLLGALIGIAALIAVLGVLIYAGMWLVLLAVRHVPIIGRRHRHAAWSQMQRDGHLNTRAQQTSAKEAGHDVSSP